MKPVLVLQHLSSDGPAYLATWMQRRGVPFEVRNTDAGEAFPEHMDAYCRAGHPGWRDERQRPAAVAAPGRDADPGRDGARRPGHRPLPGRPTDGAGAGRARRPVAGAGSRLAPDRTRTIGRSRANGSVVRDIGPVFQWHEEAFDLPAGATLLAGSPACTHQAFAHRPASGDAVSCGGGRGEAAAAGRRWIPTPSAHCSSAMTACKAGRRCARPWRGTCRSSRRWPTAIYARWLAAAMQTARLTVFRISRSDFPHCGMSARCTAAWVFIGLECDSASRNDAAKLLILFDIQ